MTKILKEEWRRTEGWRVVLLMAGTQTVTAILLIVVTILVIIHLNDVTAARRDAARDSCVLLVGLVDAATPPSRKALAQEYKAKTPLKNCTAYAKAITSPPPVVKGHKH